MMDTRKNEIMTFKDLIVKKTHCDYLKVRNCKLCDISGFCADRSYNIVKFLGRCGFAFYFKKI